MLNSENNLKNGEMFHQKQKYENYKNHYVFINELKTKVHKTSVGVIPIRSRYIFSLSIFFFCSKKDEKTLVRN